MINFGSHEDDLTGDIKVFYSGNDLDFDRVIVKETRQSFGLDSNPLVNDFLSGVASITLQLKRGGVFPITLAFLKQVRPLELNVVDNEIRSPGIFAEFLQSEEVYTDQFYKLEKAYSTNDMLFLDKPIGTIENLYSVQTVQFYVNYLTPLKNTIVEKVLNFKVCNEADREWLRQALVVIDLIRMQPNHNKRIELYKSVNIDCL